MGEVYTATMKKESKLWESVASVIFMWECEWRQRKKDDPVLQALIASFNLQEPLNPREAFFGGRTNAVTLYQKPQAQKMGYYDFTSLYPWVNKYGRYPTGHPIIIYNLSNQSISNYFGLAECTILPPPKLFHPVLPFRCGGKLVFPLCRSCAKEDIDKPLLAKASVCHHK